MKKLLIILLVIVCVLGFTACLRLPQHLPSAEAAFYELYPKDTAVDIANDCERIELISTVVDKYKAEYDVNWSSSDDDIATISASEDGVVVILTPTKEVKEFTLTATISDNKGNTINCTVTYSLYECVHEKGAKATCTTDQVCTKCGKVLEEAKGHNPGANPTCTEPQRCTDCNKVLNSALGHSCSDDGDCTTAVTCSRCGFVKTEAKAHVSEDDGDCTTKVVCSNDGCNVVITPANTHVSEDDGDCTTEVVCSNDGCNVVITSANTHVSEDDGDCTTEVKCTRPGCDAVVTAAKSNHIDGNYDGKCDYVICEQSVGERITVGKGEFIETTEEYVVYFTGYVGKFAFYFGTDESYAGDDIEVKMYNGSVFQTIDNRYSFEISEGEVIAFKLVGNVSFAIFPVPTENTEYRLGFENSDKIFYINGEYEWNVTGWLSTSLEEQDAVKVSIEYADNNSNKYRLYFINDDGNKVYKETFERLAPHHKFVEEKIADTDLARVGELLRELREVLEDTIEICQH